MHSYLKAVGFSKINNRKEMMKLANSVIENATKKRLVSIDEHSVIAELSMEFADGLGVTVCGEYDETKTFHMEHYFPFYRGQNVSTKEEVYINKRVDTDAYTGMCDDFRIGVSLIFYLQNALEFIEKKKNLKPPLVCPVILTALAFEGKILLPIEKTELQSRVNKADVKHRNQLIAEAKKGNQEAMDSLTIDDIDLFSMVSKRIQYEDIYSIVDTSFIPYGSESDNYTVLGTILDFRTLENSETKEELYAMLIECNMITFEICINKNDLLGEPLPGRRFKGTVWMQGNVDFVN